MMVTATDLLRHTWPSSRREDENVIALLLSDEGILVSYSCHFDENEDTDGCVMITPLSFLMALHTLCENDQGGGVVQGVEPSTYVTFARRDRNVDIMSCWGSQGGAVLVPLEKMVAILASLAG